ncbi:DUF2157 domain-containing protein [Nocardioides sp.]|uniref:DUF2157 domain-containing protein n=1 Tax=Nocardioides sp. TaxID=35761 RepID=UPI002ED32B3C
MTTSPTLDRPPLRPASPSQLSWLRTELAAWQHEGLIDPALAATLAARYHESRRFSVGRLLLTLGAVFVGVGLIWLVAANLDQLPPTLRFVAVAAIWVALLAAGEAFAARHQRQPGIPRPLVFSVRLLAALALGAVIFQAAQSFQVPAYEPRLVGLWAAGALVHAYVVRGAGPLLVALAAGSTWFVWQVLWDQPSGLGAVLALAVLACVGVAAASLHTTGAAGEQANDRFAAPWREVGAVFALAALFVAALPFVGLADFEWNAWLVGGLVVAGVITAVALGRAGTAIDRMEAVAGVAVAVVAIALAAWETSSDVDLVGPAEWAHAAVSVTAYVAAAIGVALLGTRHDSWRLTASATGALVVFTTFQSFAVFAPIIEGAWLFVVLGLIFLGTGFTFDRARRRLAAALEGEVR